MRDRLMCFAIEHRAPRPTFVKASPAEPRALYHGSETRSRGPHARPRVLLQVQPVSWSVAGRPKPEQLPASAVS